MVTGASDASAASQAGGVAQGEVGAAQGGASAAGAGAGSALVAAPRGSAPSFEPSAEVLQDMDTCQKAAAWAGIPGSAEDPATVLASRFAVLGVTGSVHPRIIANLAEEDYEAALGDWQINGAKPFPAHWSYGGLFGKACRWACGVDKTQSELDKAAADRAIQLAREDAQDHAFKMRELEVRLAEAKKREASAVEASGAPPPRRIKLATMVDQANDFEAEILDAAAVDRAYARFRKKMGGQPDTLSEPTLAQLSCLHDVFQSAGSPYVDFAIWGPNGE